MVSNFEHIKLLPIATKDKQNCKCPGTTFSMFSRGIAWHGYWVIKLEGVQALNFSNTLGNKVENFPLLENTLMQRFDHI